MRGPPLDVYRRSARDTPPLDGLTREAKRSRAWLVVLGIALPLCASVCGVREDPRRMQGPLVSSPAVPGSRRALDPPDRWNDGYLDVPPGSPSRGPRAAPVVIQIFTDLQNASTAREMTEYLPPLLAAHPNDVRLVFRHLLPPYHRLAEPAAEVALEARAQHGEEGFWRVASAILTSARMADVASEDMTPLWEAANVERLDLARVQTAVSMRKYWSEIEADAEVARSLGFQAPVVPWVIVGNEVVVGSPSKASLEAAIVRQKPRRAAP
jgi:protein-disulfide isomerase